MILYLIITNVKHKILAFAQLESVYVDNNFMDLASLNRKQLLKNKAFCAYLKSYSLKTSTFAGPPLCLNQSTKL